MSGITEERKLKKSNAKKNGHSPVEVPGLQIERRFTRPGVDPLGQVEYDQRRSVICDPDGSVVFSMEKIDVPRGWSQLATDIIVSKYFRKAGVPNTGSEVSVRQVVHRVSHTIREAAEDLGGYFASSEDADTFE